MNIGDKAPEILGRDENGNELRLSDFTGRKLVLYFYPKDSTPGCTNEACNLRDNYQSLLAKGYAIVGVSVQDERSHKKFIEKYQLPFPLIADTEHHLVEAFGVWQEKKMYGIDTKEYRDAFMANLVEQATPEQRAILADNTTYGDGLSLPTGLDREIWDQVTEAHPILGDVDILRTGIAIKVTKMTPAAISKKKDSDPSTEQTFTGVDVTLVGADYHTYVTLSYAEAKMSQGAMERFLVREVADAIGEALAKDVFARILSDASTAQKVTSTSDMFADVKSAMALATQARTPVIYAPATAYYEIVGAIKSGSPFNIGNTLGCQVKLDSAATKVTIVDPGLFVLNVIQDTLIESERDAKNAQFVIGGYMRAEGCLRKVKAAAYID